MPQLPAAEEDEPGFSKLMRRRAPGASAKRLSVRVDGMVRRLSSRAMTAWVIPASARACVRRTLPQKHHTLRQSSDSSTIPWRFLQPGSICASSQLFCWRECNLDLAPRRPLRLPGKNANDDATTSYRSEIKISVDSFSRFQCPCVSRSRAVERAYALYILIRSIHSLLLSSHLSLLPAQ